MFLLKFKHLGKKWNFVYFPCLLGENIIANPLLVLFSRQMRDYLSGFQEQCDAILNDVNSALQHLESLQKQYLFVSNKTGTLHQACEQLLKEQVIWSRREGQWLYLLFYFKIDEYNSSFLNFSSHILNTALYETLCWACEILCWQPAFILNKLMWTGAWVSSPVFWTARCQTISEWRGYNSSVHSLSLILLK